MWALIHPHVITGENSQRMPKHPEKGLNVGTTLQPHAMTSEDIILYYIILGLVTEVRIRR